MFKRVNCEKYHVITIVPSVFSEKGKHDNLSIMLIMINGIVVYGQEYDLKEKDDYCHSAADNSVLAI